MLEYLAAFACGLLVFQALMMKDMFGGDYWMAVRKTFFAETVSMNFVMIGMISTMVALAVRWEGSENPLDPAFWFRMSLASVAGGILAYPVNFWLVRRHLKHGCMTLPGADGPAPGLGHRSPEAGHDPGATDGRAAEPMPMEMKDLAPMAKNLWIGASFALLVFAMWHTARWVPIRFT